MYCIINVEQALCYNNKTECDKIWILSFTQINQKNNIREMIVKHIDITKDHLWLRQSEQKDIYYMKFKCKRD